MKRIYSKRNFKYYTMLKQILHDLELVDKNYWWLISDVEAYPQKEKFEDMLQEEYLLMNTNELVEMLEEDDFQWVWAVFSAIPSSYKREDILKYDIPYCQYFDEGQYNPYVDEPRIQHPYAELEIYAADSSYMFMITENDELISKFKKCYPKYIEE